MSSFVRSTNISETGDGLGALDLAMEPQIIGLVLIIGTKDDCFTN